MSIVLENLLSGARDGQKVKSPPPFPDSTTFLTKVVKDGLPEASASPQYAYAQFGRDGEKFAFDSLRYHPERALPVIVSLAKLQGTKVNPKTEEEPGKIVHEFRKYFPDLPAHSKHIFAELWTKWGDKDAPNEVRYYGSADATPLFISLVSEYCKRVGSTEVLDQVIQRGKEAVTIREVVESATQWVEDRIANGPRLDAEKRAEPHPDKRLPLLEFRRMNEQGIENQNWKDSVTSLIHENGTLVNHTQPIATIDLQGYAYDALMDAAKLLGESNPEVSQRRKALALSVRDTVLEKFWLEEKGYFAVGLDRDSTGSYRQIKTTESNAAEILNTKFFDELPGPIRQKYVGAIIRKIYSDEFLTEAGIRCRSIKESGLVNFIDYHGSYAVWTKNTSEIAKGLEKQGFYRLAHQLKIRVLNVPRVAGSFQELTYIQRDGKIIYNPRRRKDRFQVISQGMKAPAFPEEDQTWTGSAVNEFEEELLRGYQHFPPSAPRHGTWNADVDYELFARNQRVKLLEKEQEAYRLHLFSPKPYIDIRRGQRVEARFKKQRKLKD